MFVSYFRFTQSLAYKDEGTHINAGVIPGGKPVSENKREKIANTTKIGLSRNHV